MGTQRHRTLLRNNVRSNREAVWAEAYLLTLFDDMAETPVYGSDVSSHIATVFGNPSLARELLSGDSLRAKFDWWVSVLGAEQLDLFSQEDT